MVACHAHGGTMPFTVAVTDTAFSKDLITLKYELERCGMKVTVYDPVVNDPAQLAAYNAIAVQQYRITDEVVRRLDPEICKLVVKFGVGYENLDLTALTRAGIRAANVPDYGPETVAQHTLYCISSLAKHGNEYQHRMNTGRDLELGGSKPGEVVWTNKIRIPSVSLDKCVLGIIGYGRIGKKTAQLARPLFRTIIVCDPYIDGDEFDDHVERADMDTVLAEADFLTLHAPLFRKPQEVYSCYPEFRPKGIFYRPTFHLIDEQAIASMKKDAFLINTSRGPVVKESAVISALTDGKLSGAALDVFEHEPLPRNSILREMANDELPAGHPLRKTGQERYNVVLTPHAAYYTEGILRTMERLMAEEIARVLIDNELPKNLINPAVLYQ
jgi:D-3-phosphoglycerate dehydrogenase / 2-oxoglutarate reductase